MLDTFLDALTGAFLTDPILDQLRRLDPERNSAGVLIAGGWSTVTLEGVILTWKDTDSYLLVLDIAKTLSRQQLVSHQSWNTGRVWIVLREHAYTITPRVTVAVPAA
jgi:hypothetical protein